MSDYDPGKQHIRQAPTHVRTADEWRKRREMDQLREELNLAIAALSQALEPGSDTDE